MDKNRLTEYLDSLLNEGIPSVDCMVCRNHEIIYRHMNGTIDYDKSIKAAGEHIDNQEASILKQIHLGE